MYYTKEDFTTVVVGASVTIIGIIVLVFLIPKSKLKKEAERKNKDIMIELKEKNDPIAQSNKKV